MNAKSKDDNCCFGRKPILVALYFPSPEKSRENYGFFKNQKFETELKKLFRQFYIPELHLNYFELTECKVSKD